MEESKLKAQLIIHEGLRLKPYKDTVGKVTIGVGRNLDDVGISEEEAALMLTNDINKVIRALDLELPWWRDLSDNRQLVLADMCFNMGIHTLLTFKNTLKAIQEERYEDAAQGMLQSLWAKQVGRRAVKLADLMRAG